MKFVFLLIFLAFTSLRGSTVYESLPNLSLLWNNNPEKNIEKYIVQYGTESGKYTKSVETKGPTINLINLESGKLNYISVVAVNKFGLKSDPSKEILVKIYDRYINVWMSIDGGKTYQIIGKIQHPKVKGQLYKTSITSQ